MTWFTQMEVRNLIYHQFFFTANSLGCQPTTLQYFQSLAPQTLALAAAAIYCAMSEFASGKKATVMFSQDEYRGTFGPSLVINFTLDATIQSITLQRPLHTPAHPPAAELHKNRHSSIIIGAPQPRLNLFYFIPQSIPPLSVLLYSILHSIPQCPRSSAWDGSSSIPTGAPIMNSTLLTHPCSTLLHWNKHSSIPSVLLCLDWLTSISFRTPEPPLFWRSWISFRTP